MVDVVVVGAGPTGLVLSAELALAGVEIAVVDRRPDRDVVGSRAGGLHARTIELFDQRGVADRFLAEGDVAQAVGFGYVPLDIGDVPSRHPYVLALWQRHIERILAEWVDELGVTVQYGRDVTGFAQDDDGVEVEVAGGEVLRAQYIVGCDGGRSLIRKTASIGFPGWDPTMSSLIAEVELADDPPWGLRRDELGTHAFAQVDAGRVRLVVTERNVESAGEPTLGDLRAALTDVWGTDYGVRSPTSISRFTDAARQADAYRAGRVLLAGDSAHVHSPVGGQGLNTGVHDAMNLGWKLAQVVHGVSPDSLLDSYHSERHPIAARVLRLCMAQTALARMNPHVTALNETVADLLTMEEPRTSLAGMLSGLDINYDGGEGHPLLGRRMPDLDLQTRNGPTRVYEFLHEAKPVLLDLEESGSGGIASITHGVQRVAARYTGTWRLPVVGEVTSPTAVLIRPDGHVAWVGQGSDVGLHEALTHWFGDATPPTEPAAPTGTE